MLTIQMRSTSLISLLSCLLLIGCSEKQLSHEMPNLLGVWIGESIDETFSECADTLGPKTVYTARKLIIEQSSIRQIADVVSVGEYDRGKAQEILFKLEVIQFEHPINDELQQGYYVDVFEFDSEQKVLMPPGWDIKMSGMDLRRRIVSLTKNELILERRVTPNHSDSDCANKVDQLTVYYRLS